MSGTHQPIPFQKGHALSFPCSRCKNDIKFSLFELDQNNGLLSCPHCEQNYLFNDPQLKRQLRLFESLCRQIKDSEEILGNTSIGVDVGNSRVEIPFKLLLTRFNSNLQLQMGPEKIVITFRLEPQNLPQKN